MKTKLLKKVRKRYSIERVDRIGVNSHEYWRKMQDKIETPFYVITDENEPTFRAGRYHKTYEEAINKLAEWIRKDYKDKVRPIKQLSSKVWWKK